MTFIKPKPMDKRPVVEDTCIKCIELKQRIQQLEEALAKTQEKLEYATRKRDKFRNVVKLLV